MKKLIINADDFGASKGINEGIVRAYKEGIVTSTTVMTNMPEFKSAMKVAKKNLGLGVGVHLNLVDGKGFVLGKLSRNVAIKSIFGVVPYRRLVEEFQEQFARIDKYVQITHFDTHQHLGVFPNIRSAMLEVAKEFKVNKGRLSAEYYVDYSNPSSWWKQALINSNGIVAKSKMKKAGVIFPDKFFGVSSTGKFNLKYFGNYLRKINSTAELCVHPGLIKENILAGDFLEESRPQELKVLISKEAKELVKKNKIKLVSFAEL
jgi:chitin disaccharide deacetylase